MKSYSQYEQDTYVLNNFFKDKKNGTYIDIGAHDGITLSNTYLFEQIGWQGICFEPLPNIFKKLTQNRKCTCINGVISDKSDEYVDFCYIEGYSEMLSGILDDYDQRHKQRILNESQMYNCTRSKIKVKNYLFNDIVNHSKINYLSIDTEGNEIKILKSIDYKKYDIDIIGAENNYNDPDMKNFLEEKGFNLLTVLGSDWYFVNKNFK